MFVRSKIQQMMMRKRSRSIGNNKQSISTGGSNKHTSPCLLSYPRLFLGLSSKANKTSTNQETEHFAMSPTSTLEPRPFSKITNTRANPTWAHASPSTVARETKSNSQKPIGLGLIDALKNEETDGKAAPSQDSRMVLLGSKLKIQVPPLSPTGHHIEFGIKNKSSQLALCSPIDRSPIGSNACLSPRDLELLSEDYTCIISHGPNPRTTHIFDNRVVESPGTEGLMVPLRCHSDRFSDGGDRSRSECGDFLRFCHGCNKDLSPGSDVFMYRGERAFCSTECRYQEMLFDEGTD